MRSIVYHIIIPLAATIAGILAYHMLVTAPLAQTLERIQEKSAVVTVLPVADDEYGGSNNGADQADGENEPVEGVIVDVIEAPAVAFTLPHFLMVNGEQYPANVDVKVLQVSRYMLSPAQVRGVADIMVCTGVTCAQSESYPLNRLQAIVAIDLELSNKQRVGSVAIDPAGRMRMTLSDSFFAPRIAGGAGDYIEVPELSSMRSTIIFYVPATAERLHFLYGADVADPTGIFLIDFSNGVVEPLAG